MDHPPGLRRRARGGIEQLPSGSLRVRVYAGVDPLSKKRRYLVETVPAGPMAAEQAQTVRARLLHEADKHRNSGTPETTAQRRGRGPAARPDAIGQFPVPATPESEGGRRSDRRLGRMTVATIAQLAGVSPPTVSKVLNGRSGVAAETRQRVETLLREHGYRRPDKVVRSACVEVVFYGLHSHLAIEVLRGVKQVAAEQNLAVGFTDAQREASAGRSWAQDLLARRPTAVIGVHMGFISEQHALLDASAIPIVAVDAAGEPLHTLPSVGADNRSGAIAATQHLLALGHRRVAVITGPTERQGARARLEGARAAMDAAGTPLDEHLVRHGQWFSFEEGLNHARELLRLPEPPTAVMCGNDLQALGVYEAVRQVGVRIPHDLSVIGFDDISNTQWSGPPMTTVRQPLAEMGATAATLALAMAAGDQLIQTHIQLATTLIVRDSTAPPAARSSDRTPEGRPASQRLNAGRSARAGAQGR
jgi:LacI family xylobiose transport system transcriptional regulator